jgi:transcriptional regulator with XRE-family HTH domain
MFDDVTIGARLRILRKWRRLTLTELAGLSGLSPSFISMAERGERFLDRRSHIAALAAALKVSETELVGGPHLSADPLQADPHTAIPALRVALETNSLNNPLCERARPLPQLLTELDQIQPLFASCDYIRLGQRLPALIDELHIHTAEPANEAAYRLALETLLEACVFATFRSKDLGYHDLAHLAATRASEAAQQLDDPIALGKAAYLRIQTMPRAGSWERALVAAERAAATLEPHVHDQLGQQVLGMLTLSASLAAASTHQSQTAAHWLHEAGQLAEQVPDSPEKNWSCFSTSNVNVWRVTVAVEHGEAGGTVLELAGAVDREKMAHRRSRYASFCADVGRGLAREPRMRDEAVQWLRRAEEAAPQRIRNSAPARETIAVMLKQAMAAAGGRELRGMAARMGVPH